jgi:hypothetical protein
MLPLLPLLPAPVAQIPPTPKVTLADILPRARWNVAERGPLIVVNAENVTIKKEHPLSPGATFSQMLPSFGRKLIRCGGVWVVAPEKILASPDVRGLTPEKLAARMSNPLLGLLGVLDESGWRKVGQGEGLGRSDLPPKLQPLFDALVPQDAELTAYEEAEGAEEKRISLTASQRAGTRLKVRWTSSWDLLPEGGSLDFVSIRNAFMVGTDSVPQLEHRMDEKSPLRRIVVQNTQKPSDLDFEELDRNLMIAGVKTVKELVVRASQVTGKEFYVDARIENFSINAQGGQAQIGDVLQALCRAVGGTFRRVGNAYLLTEECIPWSLRTKESREIERRASWLEENSHRAIVKHLQKKSAEFRTAIEPVSGDTHPNLLPGLQGAGGHEYEIKHLPPEMQKEVQQRTDILMRKIQSGQRKISEEDEPTVTNFKVGRVMIYPQIRMWLTVPGIERVELAFGNDRANRVLEEGLLSSPPGPVPDFSIPLTPALRRPIIWPTSWKMRAVRITLTTPEDAEKLAIAAKTAQLTDVWIDVPADPALAKPLLVAAAKGGLPVTAVFAPLLWGADTDTQRRRFDLVSTSETTDEAWRRRNTSLPEGMEDEPEMPRRFFPDERVIASVIELARIPEVKGVALRELEQPGYRGGSMRWSEAYEGGYLPELRLECLRRFHVDLMDKGELSRGWDDTEMAIFPPLDGSLDFDEKWDQLRQNLSLKWRSVLWEWLKSITPKKTIYVSQRDGSDRDTFYPWNRLKPSTAEPYPWTLPIPDKETPERVRGSVNYWIDGAKLQQLLIEFPKADTATLLKYLEAIRPAAAATGKAKSAGAGR